MDNESPHSRLGHFFGLGRLLLLYVALIAFLMFTNPANLPSVMIILPFAGLFCAIYFSAVECWRPSGRIGKNNTASRHRLARPRATAAFVAGLPVLLLVLQSIGQLTVWDVLTAAAIFVIAYFYVSKSSLTTVNH